MLNMKNWGRARKIGDVIIWWTLAEFLAWRQKQAPISTQDAFDELRIVLSPKYANSAGHWHVWASGIQAGWPPIDGWRSGERPEYQPFKNPEHPLVHHREAYPIPAEEWAKLCLSSVEEIEKGKLDYARERTPAWEDVRLPRDELIAVWLPLIENALLSGPEENGSTSKREARTKAKKQMYETWLSLVPEFCFKENGRRRSRDEIAEKIASDPRAIDPTNNKFPTTANVVKRLGELRRDWWRAE